jgi:hypothetical protein
MKLNLVCVGTFDSKRQKRPQFEETIIIPELIKFNFPIKAYISEGQHFVSKDVQAPGLWMPEK